jgi:hypothetical protein
VSDLARLEAQRRREHRIDPPAPIHDPHELMRFVVETGVVMASGRSSLPTLTEAIVGHVIKGSWMADPEVHRIYDLWNEPDWADVLSAPLVQGKQVFVRRDLGPAVASIAGDTRRLAQAVVGLKPLERQLYDAVIDSGEVRMDEWAQINALKTSPARTARNRLAALFLVESEELHTDAGYHTVIVRPRKHAKPKLPFAQATREVLVAAVRACVLADAQEVRKWSDWSAVALDAALDAGDVVAIDRYVVCAEMLA